MNWFYKQSVYDKQRIESNIQRLELLKKYVHDLAYFVIASQSGGFEAVRTLTNDPLVKGRPLVLDKLKSALIGEHNQKVILDSPIRAQQILFEVEDLIHREIIKERRKLAELQ